MTDKKQAPAPRRALAPGLYVTATPIGNAGDISLRALDVLAKADAVLCEDTRVTGGLMQIHGLKVQLLPYHEHNAAEMRPRILARLARGEALALVSDAGMPLISDPGYKLVRAVQEEGRMVTCLPGASSVLAGLVLSGLPSDRFFFSGFLPPKEAARRAALEELKTIPATLIFLESPRRLAACLKDMAGVLGPREAAVTRELTKKFEEVRRAGLAELAAHYEEAGAPKGEVVLVVGPPEKAGPEAGDLDTLLATAMDELSLKEAVKEVTEMTGLPRKEVYRRALELKESGRE
ncbi:uroporphyrin-III C/tetrapyrrole methyltransferase [Tepidicaulis marinus]|uniref:Ribosomal RNA small subunit methyltransferase I n=1 Tax=Tepidicaulis marinus TaxID=1333998 RepID=A0A081B6U5_9HYPH|nr:16S rRNA (cytidine(1402)-2'-O)-methyltransferase [Tepidicaulis marinus]GAK43763.1 uroporphyrin-III C/tetrapyrrole methyltransferase [Tepidicaulis marinus]